MSEPVAVARQATFNTEPADSETASGNSIRRGNIVIPVVEEEPPEEKDPRRLSIASSGRSSPIYANGDPEIKKYRTGAIISRAPRSTRQPSLQGDSSELEILSDVGLIGDSEDTDFVPPKLSLSARKKIRKEPRIKVPSAKFDSSEPTIEEETSQDVITALSPAVSERDTNANPQVTTSGIRSETIVVDSPRRRKFVSFNLTPEVSFEKGQKESQERRQVSESSPKRGGGSSVAADTDHTTGALTPRRSLNSKPTQKTTVKTNQNSKPGQSLASPKPFLQGDEPEVLDSSFCESDWQPKGEKNDIIKSPKVHVKDSKSESKGKAGDKDDNKSSRIENSKASKHDPAEKSRDAKLTGDSKLSLNTSGHNNKSQQKLVVETDKKIISDKYETDVKPTYNTRLDAGKRWAPQKAKSSKEEGSTGKNTKETDKAIIVKSSGNQPTKQHQSNVSSELNNDKYAGLDLQHTSASLTHPRTPIISNFVDCDAGTETDVSAISDWNNDGISGIPKQGRLSKGSKASDTPRQAAATADSTVISPPPTTPRMATSDGYDYESETFEEVLNERNAMVKAERTYQRRIKQLEEELKGMVTQCQMLSDENKELRKNLESMKKRQEHGIDSVDMATRIAKLETEKENLTKSNEALTARLKENEAKMKQWESVFVENTKLKTKNAELERKVQELDTQMDSLSVRARDSDAEIQNRMSNADAKNQELHAEAKALRQENEALKAKVMSVEEDKQSMSNALEEKRKELNEVMRAMNTETATESDLKESKAKLERAQEEMNDVKKELEDMKKLLNDSEDNKAKLLGHLVQKDAEIRRMKVDLDNKDNVTADLRKAVDKGKQEIQRLDESLKASKDMEKETLALKSRIGSLKAEIESSLTENQKLKIDREEMSQQIEKLRQENVHTTDAIMEGKKYFRKWEHERDLRNKAEVTVARKEEEVQILDSRLKEAGNKMNVLYSRLRGLEDEKAQLGSANMQELATNNKILKDENKKLRQMLVERNIELTNKRSEHTVMDSRLKILERKQKDAEVRVQQLSGWVSGMDENDSKDNLGENSDHKFSRGNVLTRPSNNSQSRSVPRTHNEQRPPLRNRSEKSLQVVEPKVAYVSPRAHKKGGHRGIHSTLTPPPGWDESKRHSDGDGSNHTPLSLPLILETKSRTPPDPHGGYFMLYKDKIKRMKERKF